MVRAVEMGRFQAISPLKSQVEIQAGTPRSNESWEQVISRMQKHITDRNSPQLQALGDLLKVQSEVSRYQLKVELVSKLSESAVASVRKLQQNQ